jgi:hypothetical protein
MTEIYGFSLERAPKKNASALFLPSGQATQAVSDINKSYIERESQIYHS